MPTHARLLVPALALGLALSACTGSLTVIGVKGPVKVEAGGDAAGPGKGQPPSASPVPAPERSSLAPQPTASPPGPGGTPTPIAASATPTPSAPGGTPTPTAASAMPTPSAPGGTPTPTTASATPTPPAPTPTPTATPRPTLGLRDLQLVDPRGDATMRWEGETLVLAAPRDNNLDPGYDFDAPRVLAPVTGDFALTVRVRPALQTSYGGAGLVVSAADQSHVRMEQARYSGATAYINLGAIRAGAIVAGSPAQLPYSEAGSVLRMTRRGDVFRLEYRAPEAVAFTLAKELDLALPRELKAGVLLVSDHPETASFEARFDQFSLAPL